MVHFAVIFREKFLNDKDCLSDLLVYLSHFIHLHSSSSLAIYYAQITSQKEYLLKSMNLSYVKPEHYNGQLRHGVLLLNSAFYPLAVDQ